MSSLPPYSTYRTDAKQMMFPQATSHGNILTFTPPGFNQELSVKFPDSRLAVCAKCKKNFKTRDMCRVRNTHTSPPWTTAFICVTVDDSCLDENGQYVDKPMTVRMVQWQPYCVTKPFDPKTPVCAACKRTNRTRSFCRERHKHRQLPWCSVYVLLSTLDAADPNTVVAGASKKVKSETDDADADKANGLNAQKDDASPSNASKGKSEDASDAGNTIASDSGDTGDDINAIAESRTFLAKVSCRSTSIHWLEMAEFDSSETAPFPGNLPTDALQFGVNPHLASGPPHMEHVPPQYYQPNMNYAAQQHQNALKSRQQYFFQMQQQAHPHHHPQYPPPPVPPQGWPYQQMAPPGQGDPTGVTAGEAAAAQRRGQLGTPEETQQQMQQHQQQHWAAMYYQAPQPGAHYAAASPPPQTPLPTEVNGQAPNQVVQRDAPLENNNEPTFHTPPETEIEDQPNEKRARVE